MALYKCKSDIVVSTGSGHLNPMFAAKLMRKSGLCESVSRVRPVSLCKVAHKWLVIYFVQYEAKASIQMPHTWEVTLMIFVTVGVVNLVCELIKAMDAIVPHLSHPVIMQIGNGCMFPSGESFRFATYIRLL